MPDLEFWALLKKWRRNKRETCSKPTSSDCLASHRRPCPIYARKQAATSSTSLLSEDLPGLLATACTTQASSQSKVSQRHLLPNSSRSASMSRLSNLATFAPTFFLAVRFNERVASLRHTQRPVGKLARAPMSAMAGSQVILPWPSKRSLQSRGHRIRLCGLFSAQTL